MSVASAIGVAGGHPLGDVHPLRGCTRLELATVQECATAMWIEPGAVVWNAGELAREAVIVIEGELEAHIGGLPLGAVRAGQALGVPLALSGRGRWPYSVSAVEPTYALVISTRELQRLVFDVPDLLLRLVDDAPALFEVS